MRGTRSSRLGDVASVREMLTGRGEKGRGAGWAVGTMGWGCVGEPDGAVVVSARRARRRGLCANDSGRRR